MRNAIVFSLLAALAACATPQSSAPVYTVIDRNAVITDRARINEISFLDDDVLLIRVGAGELYRIRLLPGCVNPADVGFAARITDTGPGVDRSSRVIIGDDNCAIRSIEQVERTERTERAN